MVTPVNYMKYIPLHMDKPVNYMKYIPLHGQPCKLYEIHNLIWTTQQIIMKYLPLHWDNPCKLYEIHTLTGTAL